MAKKKGSFKKTLWSYFAFKFERKFAKLAFRTDGNVGAFSNDSHKTALTFVQGHGLLVVADLDFDILLVLLVVLREYYTIAQRKANSFNPPSDSGLDKRTTLYLFPSSVAMMWCGYWGWTDTIAWAKNNAECEQGPGSSQEEGWRSREHMQWGRLAVHPSMKGEPLVDQLPFFIQWSPGNLCKCKEITPFDSHELFWPVNGIHVRIQRKVLRRIPSNPTRISWRPFLR